MIRPATAWFAVLLAASQLAAFPVPKGTEPSSIAGTSWSGMDGNHLTTFTFEPNGKVTYSYSGNTYKDGGWTQEGNKVRWDVNNNYRQFDGVRDGHEMAVKTVNVAEYRNEFKLVLEEKTQP
jgi:hypothetical protein